MWMKSPAPGMAAHLDVMVKSPSPSITLARPCTSLTSYVTAPTVTCTPGPLRCNDTIGLFGGSNGELPERRERSVVELVDEIGHAIGRSERVTVGFEALHRLVEDRMERRRRPRAEQHGSDRYPGGEHSRAGHMTPVLPAWAYGQATRLAFLYQEGADR